MIELTHPHKGEVQLSYGGDTLNTAVYLARLGLAPHYITALGHDPYSDEMLHRWENEGIQVGHVLRHPTRLPGLYAIRNEHDGERSFFYWRGKSAAKSYFSLPGHETAIETMKQADWLFLSGISLSIFNASAQDLIVSISRTVKQRGGQVVFDPNFRAKGWHNVEKARDAFDRVISNTTLGLPTIDDENCLHGDMAGHRHASRWHDLGVRTVVLKCGARGATVYEDGKAPNPVPVISQIQPTDTTGAGDSFNAALIASLVEGSSLVDAARSGNDLAGQVVQHNGAIIPDRHMPLMVGKADYHQCGID